MSAYFVPHFLQGRRFLITGATGGAGSRTAIEISRAGGICTLSVRDAVKGEKVLRELMGQGHSLWFEGGEPVPESFDGVFHAAGSESIGAMATNSPQRTADAFAANFMQPVILLERAGSRKNALVKDGGSIVFMSSVAAIRGQTGMSLYCASKGAIEALTRAAAVELAPRRIRVNCIRAGGFASPMHTRITQHMTVEQIDAYAGRHLFGFGRTEDIAQAAMFLLGDTGRWITGSCMTVDGGFSAR